MDFPKAIFKAYDIRGLKEQVSPEIAGQVGRAVVAKLGGKTVLIGRDMRETSPQLAEALKEGVTKMGGNVVEIGLTTTSMFNWAVTTMDVDFGVMVTASHNPAEYNGMKVATSAGQPISGEELYDFVLESYEDATEIGSVTEKDVLNDYLDAVLATAGDLPDLSGVRIGIDYGNGMGSFTMQPLLERLGIEVTELYAEQDATFPNHEANPAKEDTLVDLKNVVEESDLDFGVATDGDGDRIGFVDNESVSLRGDQALAILAQHYLESNPGSKVVVSPNHGRASTDSIKEHGGELVEERIGRTFIIKKMHESGAVVGGEVSSHFFFNEFGNLESIDYAFVLMLQIWKSTGKSFADFVRPLRTYFNSGEVNIEVEDKDVVLKTLKEKYAADATVVNELDGIRLEFGEDGWFIVRPSNTEPLIRLTVEAKTEEHMKEVVEEVSQVIKNA